MKGVYSVENSSKIELKRRPVMNQHHTNNANTNTTNATNNTVDPQTHLRSVSFDPHSLYSPYSLAHSEYPHSPLPANNGLNDEIDDEENTGKDGIISRVTAGWKRSIHEKKSLIQHSSVRSMNHSHHSQHASESHDSLTDADDDETDEEGKRQRPLSLAANQYHDRSPFSPSLSPYNPALNTTEPISLIINAENTNTTAATKIPRRRLSVHANAIAAQNTEAEVSVMSPSSASSPAAQGPMSINVNGLAVTELGQPVIMNGMIMTDEQHKQRTSELQATHTPPLAPAHNILPLRRHSLAHPPRDTAALPTAKNSDEILSPTSANAAGSHDSDEQKSSASPRVGRKLGLRKSATFHDRHHQQQPARASQSRPQPIIIPSSSFTQHQRSNTSAAMSQMNAASASPLIPRAAPSSSLRGHDSAGGVGVIANPSDTNTPSFLPSASVGNTSPPPIINTAYSPMMNSTIPPVSSLPSAIKIKKNTTNSNIATNNNHSRQYSYTNTSMSTNTFNGTNNSPLPVIHSNSHSTTMNNQQRSPNSPPHTTNTTNANTNNLRRSSHIPTHRHSTISLSKLSDQALIAFLHTTMSILTSPSLTQWRKYKPLLSRLPSFTVNVSFGLHVGWAIEGAIGSVCKIDASYLSPHVNSSSRLMMACKQYHVSLLMSEQFYLLLHPAIRTRCRHIDKVLLKGVSDAINVYTFDICIKEKEMKGKVIKSFIDDDLNGEGKDADKHHSMMMKGKWGRMLMKNMKVFTNYLSTLISPQHSNTVAASVSTVNTAHNRAHSTISTNTTNTTNITNTTNSSDSDDVVNPRLFAALAALQSGLPVNFIPVYNRAVAHYLDGEWGQAKEALYSVMSMMPDDESAMSLFRFMESEAKEYREKQQRQSVSLNTTNNSDNSSAAATSSAAIPSSRSISNPSPAENKEESTSSR